MKISPQAGRGHRIAGAVLVLLPLGYFIAQLFVPAVLLNFLFLFFGVWGGVELGRYLEHTLAKRSNLSYQGPCRDGFCCNLH